jgi:hypothetical protein
VMARLMKVPEPHAEVASTQRARRNSDKSGASDEARHRTTRSAGASIHWRRPGAVQTLAEIVNGSFGVL